MPKFEKPFESEDPEYLTKLILNEKSLGGYFFPIKIILTGMYPGGALNLDKEKDRLDNILSFGEKETAMIKWKEIKHIAEKVREALDKKIIKNEKLVEIIERKLIPIELLVANYAHNFEK